jgi:hypothetical protein
MPVTCFHPFISATVESMMNPRCLSLDRCTDGRPRAGQPYKKGGVDMAKGDYSIRYNPDKLRKMIEDGKTAKEIIREFSISPYTLREHLTMLQELDKKVYIVKGLFDHSETEKPKIKKEGIVFSKKILEKTGFEPGDAFEMTVEKDRIILKKLESESQADDDG